MEATSQIKSVPGKPGWKQFTLKNKRGMCVSFLNIGGAITSITLPEGEGMVLRYENLHEYEENPLFLGALIGPVAGRVKEGRYTYNGNSYELTKNEGRHHLHGGEAGLHRHLWDVEMKGDQAVLTTESSGDGYPGVLTIQVTYTLTESNEFSVDYYAETTEARPVALTNHTYFNLAENDIFKHTLTLPSTSYLELDEELIPTGKTLEVGESFDFRRGLLLEKGLRASHPQRLYTNRGYDHFFLLDLPLFSLESKAGTRMDVWTDQSGVQVYTGHNVPEDACFAGGKSGPFTGICLETQDHPVALEEESYPSIVVTPDTPYRKRTCFTFSR